MEMERQETRRGTSPGEIWESSRVPCVLQRVSSRMVQWCPGNPRQSPWVGNEFRSNERRNVINRDVPEDWEHHLGDNIVGLGNCGQGPWDAE